MHTIKSAWLLTSFLLVFTLYPQLAFAAHHLRLQWDFANDKAQEALKTADHAEAERWYKRALELAEKIGPAGTFLWTRRPQEDFRVGISLGYLAELYEHQKRYAEAAPLYDRALPIFEKELGPEHKTVAVTLDSLATIYKHLGRFAEAELLYKRARVIFEKEFGLEHRDVAINLELLADLYKQTNRYTKAGPLYERALSIREKILGPEHRIVGNILDDLAAVYRAQGRYDEATKLELRAKAIRARHDKDKSAIVN